MVYQGASGDVIKAMVDQGARGMVIASAGAGATSGTQGEGIRYATDKGVFVVTSTRTGGGRIPRRGGVADGARPPQTRTAMRQAVRGSKALRARSGLLPRISRRSRRASC